MVKHSHDSARALRDLGRVLRALREAARITQADLAATMGVDQARVTAIEHGKGNPRFGTLDRHARALGLSGGLVELIITEGDTQMWDVVRAWRALPDAQTKTAMLETLWAAAAGRRRTGPAGVTNAEMQVLAASAGLSPEERQAWVEMARVMARDASGTTAPVVSGRRGRGRTRA